MFRIYVYYVKLSMPCKYLEDLVLGCIIHALLLRNEVSVEYSLNRVCILLRNIDFVHVNFTIIIRFLPPYLYHDHNL